MSEFTLNSYSFRDIFNVLVVGTGGTGGYVIPQLARMMYSLHSKEHKSYVKLVIADGDIVEKKNLLRQNFLYSDLGKNKAAVLADRYSKAFGVNIGYTPEYITTTERLELIFRNMGAGYRILVSCVDNNRARQVFHKFFVQQVKEEYRTFIYIDSGNEEFDGQVVVGISKCKKLLSPPIGMVYPDILEPEPEKIVSCADDLEENPQNIMANYFAAGAVLSYINNIIVLNSCPAQMTTFNSRTLAMRSMDYISPEE